MPARIGLIIPSSNRIVEEEITRFAPPGIAVHIARLRMTGAHSVPFDLLLPRVGESAATLIDARCDVVAFHCTANSVAAGAAGEARLLAALREAGAPQAATTASAIRHALDALGARKVVVITPYSAVKTEEEAEYLREVGYAVLHAKGFALNGSDQYCATPPQFWHDRTIEAARRDAEAYLITCANISTFPIIEAIEQKLDRPVVTSNQAVLWECLSLLDRTERHGCPGRLFDCLGAAEIARAAHA